MLSRISIKPEYWIEQVQLPLEHAKYIDRWTLLFFRDKGTDDNSFFFQIA